MAHGVILAKRQCQAESGFGIRLGEINGGEAKINGGGEKKPSKKI
jgi:hypothetical protein